MSLELIKRANTLIQKTMNLSDEDISKEALKFIKSNKDILLDNYLILKDTSKKVYFLAGGEGAGKSELAQIIGIAKNIDRIDADEIKKICPHYSGENSSLFQKASREAISTLVDIALKKGYSFILNGSFSEQKLQDENIVKVLKKDYEIKICFVYRPLDAAWEYTEIREEKEGLKVPENIFYETFLSSIKTVNKIIAKYPNVKLNYYDLQKNIFKENIDSLNEVIANDIDFKKDIQKAEKFVNYPQQTSIKNIL